MIAATVLMAIAAVESEALHRRMRSGAPIPQLAVLHVGRLAVAGLLLATMWMAGP